MKRERKEDSERVIERNKRREDGRRGEGNMGIREKKKGREREAERERGIRVKGGRKREAVKGRWG